MHDLYRAVPKKGFNQEKQFFTLPTRRLPSNVPYLVDNVWEFLRPDHFPSRRHSAYASPTPELALANASAGSNDPADYLVCQIEVLGGQARVAHLQVTDAREHLDVRRLMRSIPEAIAKDFGDFPLQQKTEYAALYLPGISKEELREAIGSSPQLQRLEPIIKSNSSFWDEAGSTMHTGAGELFFDLPTEAHYRLHPV